MVCFAKDGRRKAIGARGTAIGSRRLDGSTLCHSDCLSTLQRAAFWPVAPVGVGRVRRTVEADVSGFEDLGELLKGF
jgi:hypothetical protein